MRTTALFVDLGTVDEALRVACLPVSPAVLAQSLRRSAKLLTRDVAPYVCGTWVPEHQGALDAFRQEGYEVLSPGEGRRAVRESLVAQIERLASREDRPDVFVLVTHDAELSSVARRLVAAGPDVRVWGLSCSAPEALRDEALQFFSLEELLDLRVRTRALFIDFENTAFCLHELGYAMDPSALARILRDRAAEGGILVHAFAYADWHRLPPMQDASGRSLSSEAQRYFELNNIETRYLISRAGKNTADMKIADDIRTMLQEPSSPDTFIIASGDRDFAPVIETLTRQGKEVIVWGVRGKTSRNLCEVAHVEYLQEFLPCARPPRAPEGAAPDAASGGSDTAPSLWTPLVMLLDDITSRNNWSWVSFSKLVAEANQSGKLGSTEEDTRNLINQAISRGIILRERIANPNPNYPDQFIWACRPNDENPAVQAARIIPVLAVDFVWRSVIERGWDYVAFSFLLKELAACPELARPGLNLDDDWRASWVNFLVSEGKLRLERRPHPKNRRDLMKALTTPEQDVLIRIIVSVDNFCSSRNTTWEAASALLQYLACFGVEAVRVALAAGEKYGAFRLAKYPHPADVEKPATTGITLNPEVPFVARVLERRNAILRALHNAQEDAGAVWEQDVAAVAGEKACLWRSILAHERLVRPFEPGAGNGHRYLLARNHAVVRLACGLPPEEPAAGAGGNGEGHPGDGATLVAVSEEDRPQSALEADWVSLGPGVFD